MSHLIIREQHFESVHTYGVFLQTEREFEGIECWQGGECPDIFVCYSKSIEGAETALEFLSNEIVNQWAMN